MKSSNPSEVTAPRLLCRIVRGAVALRGDGAAPQAPTWGARHVAACDGCARHFHRHSEWETVLRRTARDGGALPSPELEAQIIHAVQRAHRASEPVRPRPRATAGLALWVGLAATVALAILVLRSGGSRLGGGVESTGVQAPGASVMVDYAETESGPSQASALLGGLPLQREVEAFFADARSALGFLAMNFLPTFADYSPATPVQPGAGAKARPANS